MSEKFFYAPGDWLGSRFSARQRRAIAAWCLILVFVTIPLRYFAKDAVWMVWLLSEVALLFGLWGVVSAETPVEAEEALPK